MDIGPGASLVLFALGLFFEPADYVISAYDIGMALEEERYVDAGITAASMFIPMLSGRAARAIADGQGVMEPAQSRPKPFLWQIEADSYTVGNHIRRFPIPRLYSIPNA